MKTLNEVVDLTGMSRRVIQEYEKAKLAKTPTTRNKYGHLLYDKAAIDRLWQIRFFRELGYSKKQMKAVFDDPQFDRKEALKKQLELLNEKKKKLEDIISIATMMDDIGMDEKDIRLKIILPLEDVNYNDTLSILGEFSREDMEQSKTINYDDYFDKVFDDNSEISDKIFDIFEEIIELFHNGEKVESDNVQDKINSLYNIYSKLFMPSFIVLYQFISLIIYDDDIIECVDVEYGRGSMQFCNNALIVFINNNYKNGVDRLILNSIENIHTYYTKEYDANSDEVQKEVANIEKFCSTLCTYEFGKYLFEDDQKSLKKIAGRLSKKAYITLIDKEYSKGSSQYISDAITIYCNNKEKTKDTEE